jgi:hypothetical protein
MTLLRISRCLSVATIVAGLASVAVPERASADEIRVSDTAGFVAALDRAKPGDVILLGEVHFPILQVAKRSYSGRVRIVGTALTRLAGLAIRESQNISVENVMVTPLGDNGARVSVDKSSEIEFRRVRFLGVEGKGRGVELDIARDSSRVTVIESEFTLCRSGRPCLQPGGRDISVLRSNFHDCFDCDMVRGGGSGVTLVGNTFERALRGSGRTHNDLVQILGGGPWTIVGNRFGERNAGAAQIYINPNRNNVSNRIHDVKILSNIFRGEMNYAIRLGAGQESGVGAPQGIMIANNTILSGRLSAIWLTDPWEKASLERRPVIANNIFAVSAPALCKRARTVSNLAFKGVPCSPTDRVGLAELDPSGAPLPGNLLVVDQADPAYAPPIDFYSRRRQGRPDRGAIEVGALTGSLPLHLSAPTRLTLKVAALQARKWRFTIRVRVAGAERVTARLVVQGRLRAFKTQDARATNRVALTLALPRDARRPGGALVRLQASSADGRLARRTVSVQIRR